MAQLDISINPRGAQTGARAVRSALDSVRTAARTTVGAVDQQFNRLKDTLFSVKTAVAGVLGSLAGREVLRATMAMDNMQIAMKAVAGSSRAADVEMGFVRATANRLGLELEVTGRAYTKLAAASKGTALAGENTRDIFLGIVEASTALHLTSAETEGAILAVSQMMSKGKVSAEELRGQLGERLPGAMQAMARALGVTMPELSKMLDNGELMAEQVLPKFGAELRRTFAGGLDDAINSTQAQINRFKNSLLEVMDTIGRSGFIDGLTAGMSALADTLRDPAVIQSLAMIGSLFGELIKAVAELGQQFLPELARAFNEVFESVLVGGARLLDTIAPVFEALFKPLQMAWDTFKGLPPELQAIGVIGALTLGTKGKLVILGALAALDLVDKGVKKLSAQILGVSEEELGPSIFEEQRAAFGAGGGVTLTGQEGPAESAVKRMLAGIQRRTVAPRGGTGGIEPSLIQPGAPAPVRTKADEEIDKAFEKARAATAIAESELDLTQRVGAHSQAMEVETEMLKITAELAKDKATLTKEQTEELRGLIERQVAAKTATEQLAEAEKHHEQVLKSRLEVFREVQDDIDTAKATLELQGKSRHELGIETRLLEIQQRLKKEGAELEGEELQRLREKLEEHQKLADQMELLQTPLGQFAKFAGDTWGQFQLLGVRAFQTLEDEMVQMFKAGEFNLSGFVDMFLEEMNRIAIRGLLTGPLSAALNGLIGSGAGGIGPSSGGAVQMFGGSSGAGIFSGLGGLFGGGEGGGLGKLFGFADGGSFRVGGSGGTDSQLVAFRASPNERVTVETPEQQRGSQPMTVTILNEIRLPNQGPSMTQADIINTIDANMRNAGAIRRTIKRGAR